MTWFKLKFVIFGTKLHLRFMCYSRAFRQGWFPTWIYKIRHFVKLQLICKERNKSMPEGPKICNTKNDGAIFDKNSKLILNQVSKSDCYANIASNNNLMFGSCKIMQHLHKNYFLCLILSNVGKPAKYHPTKMDLVECQWKEMDARPHILLGIYSRL